jgi:agmatinase
VLAIPHGVPYIVDDEQRGLVEAPAAVRAASRQFVDDVTRHDFDLGHAFVRDGRPRLVDAGDVLYQLGDGEGNARRAGEALAQIVARDAMPLVVGGNDSIPPMVARALAERHSFDVVTIDAHLDFRDEVDGERFGRSSPARRMGELPQVRSVT